MTVEELLDELGWFQQNRKIKVVSGDNGKALRIAKTEEDENGNFVLVVKT